MLSAMLLVVPIGSADDGPQLALLEKTTLPKPTGLRASPSAVRYQPTGPSAHPGQLRAATGPQATLIFSATHLGKGYRGINVGTGSLRLSQATRQCGYSAQPPVHATDVNADRPRARLNIPAGKTLRVASAWTAGGAHCMLGDYSFTAQPGQVYRLTNVQNRGQGVCYLRLQRLHKATGLYVEDNGMRPAGPDCRPTRS